MSESVDSLKQRLVGAFVILSLAIIFLPMIFDKPHNEGRSLLVPVPPKPDYKTIEIGKPVQPQFKVLSVDSDTGKVVEGDELLKPSPSEKAIKKIELGALSDEASKPSDDVQVKSPSSPAAVKKSPKPKEVKPVVAASKRPLASKPKVSHLPVFKNIWMVQLGTFSKTENAYKLRDKLRADGFDGHTKEVLLGGKKAIRVFTGPFVKKREAEKTKKKLDQKYKVDSRLIFFDA
ncbi:MULTISPECIES: SPOR domain-containing protein [unclassified Oleiphilus]|jgi:DedD protein|uniref:SPOR domain-containing protein n=4 Tax=Oleiphilus TaxID=141450 RepID=UPI0007C36ADE